MPAALAPSADLEDHLLEVMDEDSIEWDREPLDTGNKIDGQPWGWFQTGDDWVLIPMDFFGSAVTLAAYTDWMSQSMTGMEVAARCLLDAPVAMSWLWDDIYGFDWFTVQYDASDDTAVARDFVQGVLGRGESECWLCEWSGWETTLFIAASVPSAAVGDMLALRWAPCPDHRSVAADSVLEIAERAWRWEDDRFVAAEWPGETEQVEHALEP